MKAEFEALLRQEGRVVLMRTDSGSEPTEAEWELAVRQTRQTIAALLPDCRWDCRADEAAIRALADRLYLDFEEGYSGKKG